MNTIGIRGVSNKKCLNKLNITNIFLTENLQLNNVQMSSDEDANMVRIKKTFKNL